MSDYQLVADQPAVKRLRDAAFIPLDTPGNRDWEAYEQWLAAGNKPDPAPAPPPVAAAVNEVEQLRAEVAEIRQLIERLLSSLPAPPRASTHKGERS